MIKPMLSIALAVAAVSFADDDAKEMDCGTTCQACELPASAIVSKAETKLDSAVALIRGELSKSPVDAAGPLRVAEFLGDDWQIVSVLRDESKSGEERLKIALDRLAFRPYMQAQTPPGWPAFTPIGEVELKQYPKYRMAVIDRDSGLPEQAFFFQLFSHIQRNDVKMTAPVEMEVKNINRGMPMQSMAFLYETADQGTLGEDGRVKVIEVSPWLGVGIGMRGNPRADKVLEATKRLDAFLESKPMLERAGNVRVMGYNDPSVPDEREYFEVIVPVKVK